MAVKTVPLGRAQMEDLARRFPTPFHLYDEKAIRENARRLLAAFDWAPAFREYFAVKACPNPHILKLLSREGFGADCSSLPELLLAEKCGITGERIMFTSNDTPAEEYRKARALGAVINLDDITHIPFLAAHAGLPELLCFRYNPGPLREGNAIIGKPEEAKYGFTRAQLLEGYQVVRGLGVKRFGLHTMVASNELNPQYFVDTARMLFGLAVELQQAMGIRLEFVNLGGGIGIPYRPEQEAVDLSAVSRGIRAAYDEVIRPHGLHPLRLYMEMGRLITGPYGYLVTRVLHLKDTYRKYAGVDACMSSLMRPGMYGAYHHITVLGKEDRPKNTLYDVTGSLCENNDKFAIQRPLPEVERGDLLVIHDTGAHGHAMGFNYNGKLRPAELLLRPDGSVTQIRRAETVEDYFATLDFSRL
jgi:diaminopimelate decarboxylase